MLRQRLPRVQWPRLEAQIIAEASEVSHQQHKTGFNDFPIHIHGAFRGVSFSHRLHSARSQEKWKSLVFPGRSMAIKSLTWKITGVELRAIFVLAGIFFLKQTRFWFRFYSEYRSIPGRVFERAEPRIPKAKSPKFHQRRSTRENFPNASYRLTIEASASSLRDHRPQLRNPRMIFNNGAVLHFRFTFS